VVEATQLRLAVTLKMSRSKAELLSDWLELLRSGQYEQTRGELHNRQGYCCLGVAAEGLFNVEWEFDSTNEWYEYQDGEEYACDNTLIPSHAEAMGLDQDIGFDELEVYNGIVKYIAQDWNEEEQHDLFDAVFGLVAGASRENYLIHLNDHGFSFKDIAMFVQLAGWIPEARAQERIAELEAFTQEIEGKV